MRSIGPGALCCLLAFVGCSGERQRLREEIMPTRAQLLKEGRRTYERACAPCHGADARGEGPEAASGPRPPDLTVLARDNGGVFPRQQVLAVVTGDTPVAAHGTQDMPVWRTHFGPTTSGATAAAALLTRRRLDGMLDYLETLQERS